MGSGRFVEPKTIEVISADGDKRIVYGKRVVINTGTHATIDLTPGLREATCYGSALRPVGVGAVSQPWILAGRMIWIADAHRMTESVSLRWHRRIARLLAAALEWPRGAVHIVWFL